MEGLRGAAHLASSCRDIRLRFACIENQRRFDAEPERFLPRFGGFCANGIVHGIPRGGNGDAWRVHEGRPHIFGGPGSRDAFLPDVKANLALAESYWKDEIEGRNRFWQRRKRLLFRVPHYESGEQLAEDVAEAEAAGRSPHT
jgi:hypothetical protein